MRFSARLKTTTCLQERALCDERLLPWGIKSVVPFGIALGSKEGASYLGELLITNPSASHWTLGNKAHHPDLAARCFMAVLEPHRKVDVTQKALMKEVKSPHDLMFVQSRIVIQLACESLPAAQARKPHTPKTGGLEKNLA